MRRTVTLRWAEASAFLIFSTLALSLLIPAASPVLQAPARSLFSGPEYWGVVETFGNATTGTAGPATVNDVTIYGLTDIGDAVLADTVVLDNWLYIMTAADASGTVMRYEPSGPTERTDDWNLSLEVTKTKEDSFYESVNLTVQAGQQAMIVYLCNETDDIQAGIRLMTGSPAYEGIQLYDPIGASWANLTEDMWPAFPHESQSFGLRPDRYFVAFAHENNSPEITVTVLNQGTGVVFSGNVAAPSTSNIIWPRLRVDMSVDTGSISVYPIATGWIIDNLMFRSTESRHPITEPVYELVEASDPVWISVSDIHGNLITDASVTIEGHPASFNAASMRYEALFQRAVDWDVKYNFTVVADGVHISDSVAVTTLMDPLYGIEAPRWWNGWDWVSVFGRDDCSDAMSAGLTYAAFDHPTTSYMISAFTGSSEDILETQSEIALHYPHEYKTWGHKSYSEALVSAVAGQEMLDGVYDFASKWDDPNYVGMGDSYISLANPGNTASWEMMFAQFQTGIRMMGTSSWTYLGGNSSLIGSYWINVPTDSWLQSWTSWHPNRQMDMMDMLRSVNTDHDNAYQLPVIEMTAENSGVVRFYNHDVIANASLLEWVTEPKTDFAYENWKATDGEVASYVYGRSSTDVKVNPSSSGNTWIFDVSRQDPTPRGYWRVPVTLSFDLTDKDVSYVRIVSGEWDLNTSDGTLPHLNESREMGVGWDIRGDTLYLSYFWNESSQIEMKILYQDTPQITSSDGDSQAYSYVEYHSFVTCTAPDDGPSVWTLDTDASWLTIESSNDTTCVVSGVPGAWGIFHANITVSDGNSTSYLNWSITVTRMKTISGHVLNDTNEGIAGLFVTVTVKNGGLVRTILGNTTDKDGFFTVMFTNDEWFVGDAIEVSATYDNRTEENSTLATAELSQELDLQFVPIIPEFGVWKVALVVASVATLITAVALLWRRKRSLKNA